MRTREPRSIAAALLALLLGTVLLAGCGGDEGSAASDGASEDAEASAQSSPSPEAASPSPEASSSSPAAPSSTPEASSTQPTPQPTPQPQCADVWVDGATLPAGYASCYAGEAEVEPDRRRCSSGQLLLVHDERFWAVRGGPVTESRGAAVSDDQRYRAVLATCSA